MKNDLWKWVAGVLIGVGTTSIGTQIAWFVAFEKDAISRDEFQKGMHDLDQRAVVADNVLRAEMRELSAEMSRRQTDLRNTIDGLRMDFGRFEKESTADRKSLNTKMDMIISLIQEKHPPGK